MEHRSTGKTRRLPRAGLRDAAGNGTGTPTAAGNRGALGLGAAVRVEMPSFGWAAGASADGHRTATGRESSHARRLLDSLRPRLTLPTCSGR